MLIKASYLSQRSMSYIVVTHSLIGWWPVRITGAYIRISILKARQRKMKYHTGSIYDGLLEAVFIFLGNCQISQHEIWCTVRG